MSVHGLRYLPDALSGKSSPGETQGVTLANYRCSRRQGRPGALFPSRMRSADMPDPNLRARVLEHIIGQASEPCGRSYVPMYWLMKFLPAPLSRCRCRRRHWGFVQIVPALEPHVTPTIGKKVA